MKNLVLASQCETIRLLPGEALFAGTPDVDVCHVEILRADNGRVSLTHVDRLTDPEFMNREIEWLKNGNSEMPIHRISVRTNQPTNTSMQRRLTEFEKKINYPFDNTEIKTVPEKQVVLYSMRSNEVSVSQIGILAATHPENRLPLLEAKKRMLLYTLDALFTGRRHLQIPSVVYDNSAYTNTSPALDTATTKAIEAIMKHPSEGNARLHETANQLLQCTGNMLATLQAKSVLQLIEWLDTVNRDIIHNQAATADELKR